MSKSKKWFSEEEQEPIEEEAVKELEKLESDDQDKEIGRLKVTSNRAYIFTKADLTSRSVAAVGFGSLLMLLEESEDFFKVRVPRREGSVYGFIRKTKVKRI